VVVFWQGVLISPSIVQVISDFFGLCDWMCIKIDSVDVFNNEHHYYPFSCIN
jgi:hypothetical protein